MKKLYYCMIISITWAGSTLGMDEKKPIILNKKEILTGDIPSYPLFVLLDDITNKKITHIRTKALQNNEGTISIFTSDPIDTLNLRLAIYAQTAKIISPRICVFSEQNSHNTIKARFLTTHLQHKQEKIYLILASSLLDLDDPSVVESHNTLLPFVEKDAKELGCTKIHNLTARVETNSWWEKKGYEKFTIKKLTN